MIKFTTKNFVDVTDFDALVTETYGRPYNFQQQDGCKGRGTETFSVPSKWGEVDYPNDSIPEIINGEEMGVSFKAWLSRDVTEWNGSTEDARFLELFWARNFYPSLDMVVKDLHEKGLIPEGEYVIDIDW